MSTGLRLALWGALFGIYVVMFAFAAGSPTFEVSKFTIFFFGAITVMFTNVLAEYLDEKEFLYDRMD